MRQELEALSQNSKGSLLQTKKPPFGGFFVYLITKVQLISYVFFQYVLRSLQSLDNPSAMLSG